MNTQPLRRRVHPHIAAPHYPHHELLPPLLAMDEIERIVRHRGQMTDVSNLMAIAQVLCLTDGGSTPFSEEVAEDWDLENDMLRRRIEVLEGDLAAIRRTCLARIADALVDHEGR
jgi:hypothetical protein